MSGNNVYKMMQDDKLDLSDPQKAINFIEGLLFSYAVTSDLESRLAAAWNTVKKAATANQEQK